MQSKTIINLIKNEKHNHFILEHINDDVFDLSLSASKYPDIEVKALSGLISIYQKAKIKLPEHYMHLAAFNKKSYEQATSERVALFKTKIMNLENKSVLNICGGIGVDDWAFSKIAKSVDSCELDTEVHEMAQYNLDLFKIKNINRHLTDGLKFAQSAEQVDIIYIDPDRRPQAGKVFKLEDCEPEVLPNLLWLLDRAEVVWLKLSPMIDLTYLENAIPFIQEIYCISWQEEIKEILVSCSKKKQKQTRPIRRVAVRLKPEEDQVYEELFGNLPIENAHQGSYLYEPDNSIIKSGLSVNHSEYCNLPMLAKSTHLYISDHLYPHFQGRSFKIIKQLNYKPKEIASYIKEKGIQRADMSVRNFGESVLDLRKRFKLNKTGKHVLFFCSDYKKLRWMFHLEPI